MSGAPKNHRSLREPPKSRSRRLLWSRHNNARRNQRRQSMDPDSAGVKSSEDRRSGPQLPRQDRNRAGPCEPVGGTWAEGSQSTGGHRSGLRSRPRFSRGPPCKHRSCHRRIPWSPSSPGGQGDPLPASCWPELIRGLGVEAAMPCPWHTTQAAVQRIQDLRAQAKSASRDSTKSLSLKRPPAGFFSSIIFFFATSRHLWDKCSGDRPLARDAACRSRRGCNRWTPVESITWRDAARHDRRGSCGLLLRDRSLTARNSSSHVSTGGGRWGDTTR